MGKYSYVPSDIWVVDAIQFNGGEKGLKNIERFLIDIKEQWLFTNALLSLSGNTLKLCDITLRSGDYLIRDSDGVYAVSADEFKNKYDKI